MSKTENVEKKIHVFINDVPEGRGIRCAIGFQEFNGNYYGWYIGYSGGGCQQENYFKLSTNLKEFENWCGDEDGLDECCENKELTDEEYKLMQESWLEVSNFFNPNDESWTTIDPEDLEKFNVFGEDYQYETKDFINEVLWEVSKHWSLLTSYSKEGS